MPERVSSPLPLVQPRVPWWASASAVVAPVALLGAWLIPEPVWWLSPFAATLAGSAHVVTATGLRPVDPAGRVSLAAGGALAALSGWLPLVSGGLWHTMVTNLAWVTLSVWPALIAPDHQPLPRVLRRSFGECLAVALGALLLLCVVTRETVIGAGHTDGLPQHLLMTAQAAVPLIIVVGLRLTAPRGQSAPRARDAPPRVPSSEPLSREPERRARHHAEGSAISQPEAEVRRPADALR